MSSEESLNPTVHFDGEGYEAFMDGYVAALMEHTDGDFDEQRAKERLQDELTDRFLVTTGLCEERTAPEGPLDVPSENSPIALEHEEEMERMREEMERQNEETRQQTECEVCGDRVPDEDFSKKFMQAGGVLAGPFCGTECFWGFLA